MTGLLSCKMCCYFRLKKFSMTEKNMTSKATKLCIISLLTLVAVSSAERQEMRDGLSLWTLQDGGQRRCLPILQCGINNELRPCLVGGKHDRCIGCPLGKINMDATSSWSYFPCYSENVCPEGTVKDPDPSPSSPSCNPRCKCNPQEGWVGLDSCQCTKVDSKCGDNTYLNTEGHCTACPEGTYKAGLGYGPCLNISKTALLTKILENLRTSSLMIDTTTATSKSTTDSSVLIDRSSAIDPPQAKENETDMLSDQNETKWHFGTQNIILIVIAAVCLIILWKFIKCVVHLRNRGNSEQHGHRIHSALRPIRDIYYFIIERGKQTVNISVPRGEDHGGDSPPPPGDQETSNPTPPPATDRHLIPEFTVSSATFDPPISHDSVPRRIDSSTESESETPLATHPLISSDPRRPSEQLFNGFSAFANRRHPSIDLGNQDQASFQSSPSINQRSPRRDSTSSQTFRKKKPGRFVAAPTSRDPTDIVNFH